MNKANRSWNMLHTYETLSLQQIKDKTFSLLFHLQSSQTFYIRNPLEIKHMEMEV